MMGRTGEGVVILWRERESARATWRARRGRAWRGVGEIVGVEEPQVVQAADGDGRALWRDEELAVARAYKRGGRVTALEGHARERSAVEREEADLGDFLGDFLGAHGEARAGGAHRHGCRRRVPNR